MTLKGRSGGVDACLSTIGSEAQPQAQPLVLIT